MTAPVIRTRALTKRYRDLVAVDGVDLEVEDGDVFGFLGANGSGKTTTVRMLLGLALASSGDIELLGQPVPRAVTRVLPQVGCLVEGPAAYGHLSGRANLRLLDAAGPRGRGGRRNRAARVDLALERLGLTRAADRKVRGYSLGMRQRLGLAAALLQEPRLLVLDEPTNGLDPQGIREVRDLLLELNRGGTTVFLSSHLLAEVEQLCTRVAVLDRGRLVVQQDLAELRRPTGRTVVVTPDPAAAVALLDGRVVAREGERLLVRGDDAAALNAALVQARVRVLELHPERRGLEQVVLEATTGSGDVR
ncbi:MAG: Efflux ABC transporter, ATP-binding protein [uncultured Nocardioidaceae bacterium]|uniref:Efflux ABC transporter, ATP-binding protein n=1 Tax=uncultured Nocardioidaceae bacterium TaxID=253824 RepID=A0A6J4M311_9ACTN|nr:MAG: Efflux ABC transporter, ATP-binding protein [uncultured Nocardioidaceae bacterium]